MTGYVCVLAGMCFQLFAFGIYDHPSSIVGQEVGPVLSDLRIVSEVQLITQPI